MNKMFALLAAAMAVFVANESKAAEFYARHGLTSAQYQAAFNQYVGQGFRLAAVDGYSTPGGVRYAAICEKRPGHRWVARHGLNAAQYQSAFNKYTAQGYRPVDISATGHGQGNGAFAALWDKSSGQWVARHGLTSAQYQAAFNDYVGKGYRLTDVEGYMTQGGVVRYAAVWVRGKGPTWIARHGLNSAQYQAAFNNAVAKGYILVKVDGCWTPAGVRYAAIWEKRASGPWVARHGMTSAQYQAEFNKYVSQGYRLTHVSGYTAGGKQRYAAIWKK